jgi:hypothetical protein
MHSRILAPALFLLAGIGTALNPPVAAAAAGEVHSANLIAVGEGTSSPTLTSTVNYSIGYTHENPVGVIYQNSIRLTGEYDQDGGDDTSSGNGSDALGAELGYGGGSWGLAVGYRKRDCDGCDGTAAGALGLSLGDIGFGIRFQEDIYSVGFLFNANGTHRIGIMAELAEENEEDSVAEMHAAGIGYSYVASSFTFSLDASGRETKDDDTADELLSVTPGLMVRGGPLQVSVNDHITFRDKDDSSTSNEDDTKHDFWWGIGIGASWGHLAVYGDYVNELAVAGSLFF